MTISRWMLVLLVAMAIRATAEQEAAPTLQEGPLAIGNEPVAAPKPDADGVYRIGPGIQAPTLVKAAPAAYPASVEETDHPHIRIFAVVVGADGTPSKITRVSLNESEYDAGAMEAIRQSVFQAGTLNGKPVPVLVHVRVPFFHLETVVPEILRGYAHPGERAANGAKRYDVPPKPIHTAEAEFSDQARRERISGTVLVSLVVDTNGMPTEIRVVRGAGYGLDEKAVQAVRQYRFKPATKDGQPVAAPISVEVMFRLYTRPG